MPRIVVDDGDSTGAGIARVGGRSTMFVLRVLSAPERSEEVVATLAALDGVGNLIVVGVTRDTGAAAITLVRQSTVGAVAHSALWVLLVNVIMLCRGCVLTLLLQRSVGRRYA